MRLRAGSTITDKENIISKIVPRKAISVRARIVFCYRDEEGFGPERPRMAIGNFLYRRNERHV